MVLPCRPLVCSRLKRLQAPGRCHESPTMRLAAEQQASRRSESRAACASVPPALTGSMSALLAGSASLTCGLVGDRSRFAARIAAGDDCPHRGPH